MIIIIGKPCVALREVFVLQCFIPVSRPLEEIIMIGMFVVLYVIFVLQYVVFVLQYMVFVLQYFIPVSRPLEGRARGATA